MFQRVCTRSMWYGYSLLATANTVSYATIKLHDDYVTGKTSKDMLIHAALYSSFGLIACHLQPLSILAAYKSFMTDKTK